MVEHPERVTVLLGAGASVEAGIPASVALTNSVVAEVGGARGQFDGTSHALHAAIGAMIAHDTARGADAFAGLDVERLFSAIQMLSVRDELEVAPFISAWTPALEAVGPTTRFPSFFHSNFVEALQNDPFDNKLKDIFREAVKATIEYRDSASVFKALETAMVESLVSALEIDATKVDYLGPLLNLAGGGAQRIATLNYDRSIEMLAGRAGRTVDTGMGMWEGGFDWSFDPSAEINLLKMHGSIDWTLQHTIDRDGNLLAEEKLIPRSAEHVADSDTLGVVFGKRGKLRAEGPFLAMHVAFGRFLKETDRLVIVGYSFRDEHINVAIRRWFNSTSSPALTIIEPALRDSQKRWEPGRFLTDLLARVYETQGQSNSDVARSPHVVSTKFAGEALLELFGPGPKLSAPEQTDDSNS